MPRHPSTHQRPRRSTIAGWRTLSSARLTEPAPPWPLDHLEPSAAELRLWEELWTRPVAVVWREQWMDRLVARFVLHSVVCETREPSTRLLAETRHAENACLLTPTALTRAHITIVDDEPEAPLRSVTPMHIRERRRLMAVDPDPRYALLDENDPRRAAIVPGQR